MSNYFPCALTDFMLELEIFLMKLNWSIYKFVVIKSAAKMLEGEYLRRKISRLHLNIWSKATNLVFTCHLLQ
jgi:hypothetical protein